MSNTNQISDCLTIPSMSFLCLLWMQMQGIRYSVTSCVCIKFPSSHRRVLNVKCNLQTLFEYACLQSKTTHFHYVKNIECIHLKFLTSKVLLSGVSAKSLNFLFYFHFRLFFCKMCNCLLKDGRRAPVTFFS